MARNGQRNGHSYAADTPGAPKQASNSGSFRVSHNYWLCQSPGWSVITFGGTTPEGRTGSFVRGQDSILPISSKEGGRCLLNTIFRPSVGILIGRVWWALSFAFSPTLSNSLALSGSLWLSLSQSLSNSPRLRLSVLSLSVLSLSLPSSLPLTSITQTLKSHTRPTSK